MISRWNTLECLASEEDITGFLDAALEAGGGDARFFCKCLAKAAMARTINQLAKEAEIDRKALCAMFQNDPDNSPAPNDPAISHDAMAKVARAFALPAQA